jgi:uncharacterized protein (TIGR00369 family)
MSTPFTARDPTFEARVRASFARQAFMETLGARIEHVRPGDVLLSLPFSDALTQQHGFLHAGAATSVIDSACGYAALSLASPDAGVLSVEFKVNLLAPATGDAFYASGRVLRSGRTLCVCQGELRADAPDSPTVLVLMQCTIMFVRDREGVRD